MSNPNFQAWLDQADIPLCHDEHGNPVAWYDAETGFPYDPNHDYRTGGARKKLSTKAQDARNIAKAFGGLALKGTARQKEWAEKIRAEKLKDMDMDQAEMACDRNGLLTHSKFWIENRNARGHDIGAFVQEQKALLQQAMTLKAQGKAEEYAEIAGRYNALTEKWGF